MNQTTRESMRSEATLGEGHGRGLTCWPHEDPELQAGPPSVIRDRRGCGRDGERAREREHRRITLRGQCKASTVSSFLNSGKAGALNSSQKVKQKRFSDARWRLGKAAAFLCPSSPFQERKNHARALAICRNTLPTLASQALPFVSLCSQLPLN